ncbi:MAG: hypothetical protein APF83_10105 [Lutibacter sp. BRH_c52]|nr:MAG: hypothetical protein APF83_10105 [Lutibacter sp. BRH_c52]
MLQDYARNKEDANFKQIIWAFPANWRAGLFAASPRHAKKGACGLSASIPNAFKTKIYNFRFTILNY